jgi:hypothetical protein
MFRFSVHRGYPFVWHHRGQEFTGVVPEDQALAVLAGEADAAVPAVAARVGGVTNGIDRLSLLADLAFWGAVTLTVVVGGQLVVGRLRRPSPR